MTKREIVEKYQANSERMRAIAEACEREQRERTDAESKEFEALRRDNDVLQMRMAAGDAPVNNEVNVNAVLRENIRNSRQTPIVLERGNLSHVVTSDVAGAGIIPVKVAEILDPLAEGLILDKVGLPLYSGLAGSYVWPTYEAIEASIVGEGVELSDTAISMSKLTASPKRIGVAIPVTRQTINQTEGVVEDIIRKVIPQGLARLLNKILFSTEAYGSQTDLVGPFYGKTPKTLSSTPTFAELNAMKAAVLESGVDGDKMCWVMTKTQKAILEGTPINSNGIYRPLVENDMLCGLPIFTTNYIRKSVVETYKYSSSNSSWAKQSSVASTPTYEVSGDSSTNALATIASPSNNDTANVTIITEYIGLGDWRYQPMGLFGEINFVVDPFSKARNDAVDFVLNADYATVTLREDAFVLGQVSPVSNS